MNFELDTVLDTELDAVVITDMTDDALELAAGSSVRGLETTSAPDCTCSSGNPAV